jgi:CopA family copper-resistance protein
MVTRSLTRRRFLRGSAAAGAAAGLRRLSPTPAAAGLAAGAAAGSVLSGEVIDLVIRRQAIDVAGRQGTATLVNGSLPGPLLRLREGAAVTIRVANELEEASSIHWHGLLVPWDMDGVPGLSFPGIMPGQAFTYRFTLRQNGTYWYHSHSGNQEQTGIYGPLVIDPAERDPIAFDREHVVMLSDWTFEDPQRVIARLKKLANYYNFNQLTVGDFFRDVRRRGWAATLADRLMWGGMRMDPTDIADVTGYAYTYLINGLAPDQNWTALFEPGERIRLRFINAGAMTHFDVRIPGLEMTLVQADGQLVEPVAVEEFRMAPAETYDVIVRPGAAEAYTIFAETMDRSGYASGSLAPRPGMRGPIPPRRERPRRTMADMGMVPSAGMEHGATGSRPGMAPASGHGGEGKGHDMPDMTMPSGGAAPPAAATPIKHGPDTHGPGNSMVAMWGVSRLDEPGTGLEGSGRRVLVYADLRRRAPAEDRRPPAREIELHLTGNMERYMWSIDGKKYSEAPEPIPFRYGERLRIVLWNDTMMDHPMHLHGMWMVFDNGAGARMPSKHTINVKAGERLSFIVAPDERGPFAFHCHLLIHMEMGMFRVVSVADARTARPSEGGDTGTRGHRQGRT